jgi:hypothetical protein
MKTLLLNLGFSDTILPSILTYPLSKVYQAESIGSILRKYEYACDVIATTIRFVGNFGANLKEISYYHFNNEVYLVGPDKLMDFLAQQGLGEISDLTVQIHPPKTGSGSD